MSLPQTQVAEPATEAKAGATTSKEDVVANIAIMSTKELNESLSNMPVKDSSAGKTDGSETKPAEIPGGTPGKKAGDGFEFDKAKYTSLTPDQLIEELEKTKKENFHKDKLRGKLEKEVFDARTNQETIKTLTEQRDALKTKILSKEQISEIYDEGERTEAIVESREAKNRVKDLESQIVTVEVQEKNREQLLQICPKFEESLGDILTMLTEEEGQVLADTFKKNVFSFPAAMLIQVNKRYESKVKVDSLQKENEALKLKVSQISSNAKDVTEKIKNNIVGGIGNVPSLKNIEEENLINPYEIALMSTKDLKASIK